MTNLIVTFCNEKNIGAMLQSYALQETLTKYGQTYLLNYDLKNVNTKLSRKIKDNLLKITDLYFYSGYRSFAKKYYNLTKKVKNLKEISKEVKKYTNVICGSDQVWNEEIVGYQRNIYMLDFDINNKISYAASIGREKISDEEKKHLSILKDFDSISVREESAKHILENIGISNVDVTLDPTLLLSKEQWDKLIEQNKFSNYIFVYCLEMNDKLINSMEIISKRLNKKLICYYKKSILKKNPLIPNCLFLKRLSPTQFLSMVKYSDFVITNSFHGTIFSIIFEKKFIVIPHATRGIRQINLLEKLGLLDRMDIYNINNIDYSSVNKILLNERQKSLRFLSQSLKVGINE